MRSSPSPTGATPSAHRENTLPAFAAAVALGADMVELDLRRTRDGRSSCCTTRRCSACGARGLGRRAGPGRGGGLGDGDVRIPTLREVIGRVAGGADGRLHPARGGARRPGPARAAGGLGRCLFVTGNVEALRLLRGRRPGPRRPDLGGGRRAAAGLLDELGAEYWNPTFAFVRRGGVGGARRRVDCLDLDGRRAARTWPGWSAPAWTPW